MLSLTVERLQAACGVTPSHLARLFPAKRHPQELDQQPPKMIQFLKLSLSLLQGAGLGIGVFCLTSAGLDLAGAPSEARDSHPHLQLASSGHFLTSFSSARTSTSSASKVCMRPRRLSTSASPRSRGLGRRAPVPQPGTICKAFGQADQDAQGLAHLLHVRQALPEVAEVVSIDVRDVGEHLVRM